MNVYNEFISKWSNDTNSMLVARNSDEVHLRLTDREAPSHNGRLGNSVKMRK